jgi:hypothetical protein
VNLSLFQTACYPMRFSPVSSNTVLWNKAVFSGLLDAVEDAALTRLIEAVPTGKPG